LLIGRAETAGLRLDDRRVSGEHATLLWRDGEWILRDLGSRNGTFVDGVRLDAGAHLALGKGAALSFGQLGDGWELADSGAPSAIASNLSTGALCTAEDGILGIPNDAPRVVVYGDGRGGWLLEEGDQGARPVRDGEVFTTEGHPWRIQVPATVEGTATVDVGPTIDSIRLRFAVSRDEEHVQVTVLHRGSETKLEPREHGYVLLTLARARLEEHEQPLAEQGWLDRDSLLKMLGMDSNALNVAIYRARGQLSGSGVDGAAGVVQVRRGQRRLGLEPSRIEITRL
jgi:hypothetical protein